MAHSEETKKKISDAIRKYPKPPEGYHRCSHCKEILPHEDFPTNNSKPIGHGNICRKCMKIYDSKPEQVAKRKPRRTAYIKTEAGKLQSRKQHLKRTFGLTLEEYDQMFEEQNGVCAICGRINDNGRRLCVDHNHTTGQVRALLCTNCNTAIGLLNEDKQRISSVIDYLDKYNLTGDI